MYELVIESGRAEKNYWTDLWRYRELFYILAWRDISVRYKQTAIGVIWAVLRPFLAMVIFHDRIWPARQDAVERYSVSHSGVCCQPGRLVSVRLLPSRRTAIGCAAPILGYLPVTGWQRLYLRFAL
jgi:hypothetical protein